MENHVTKQAAGDTANVSTPTSPKVSATLRRYTGPLSRFLEKQAEAKSQAVAEAAKADTLRAMRNNVLSLVEDTALFTDTERLRTNDSVYQTTCVAQLQRWFRNVYRVSQERTARALRLGTSDLAGELAYNSRLADLLDESGLTHSELLSL
ncbi:hypothetical protein [Hymenobacter sp. GOD-10R]|uniref:hypothetical protein n=1 Tax=Hymenobacter sp. GOD-10R TaxID=3093922 RepID=UPI002D788405|nr:hypothetical protein [Hymenobacter sp. GOD-10R]WRQ27098.1 hypothetical protein SD425_18655 [Hymenobacter sp. GOD-10R]